MTGFNDNYIGGVLGGLSDAKFISTTDGWFIKRKFLLYLISLYSYSMR